MFGGMRTWVAFGLVAAACLVVGCMGEDRPHVVRWTVQQAESITSVRGQPVRVRHCRGAGSSERRGDAVLYSRFKCLAGARASFQQFDTVAVLYVIHPLADYDGRTSRHRLTNVRFIGGPGVP
jgi:hypothetical protein